MAIYYGFNAPFVSSKGVLPRQEDIRLIQNDVLAYIMTLPGERIYRDDFGTLLRAAIMEPMTGDVIESLQSDLINGIAANEPRLVNVNVQLTATPSTQTLNVVITGQLVNNPAQNFLLKQSINAPGLRS